MSWDRDPEEESLDFEGQRGAVTFRSKYQRHFLGGLTLTLDLDGC